MVLIKFGMLIHQFLKKSCFITLLTRFVLKPFNLRVNEDRFFRWPLKNYPVARAVMYINKCKQLCLTCRYGEIRIMVLWRSARNMDENSLQNL